MKRVHRSLALALTVLAIGGGSAAFVYLTDVNKRDTKKAAEIEQKRLFHFGRVDARGLVVFARGSTISFARDPHFGWRITSPIDVPADDTAVSAALDHLAGMSVEPAEDASDPAEYGLLHPRIWAKIELGSQTLTLFVGDKNALDERYFVTDGTRGTIYRARNDFYWTLDRALDAFREKRVFPFDPSQIARVSLSTPEGLLYTIERRASGLMVKGGSGEELRGDEGEINLVLVALTNRLKAERFITDALPAEDPDTLERLGFRHFDRSVEIALSSGFVMKAVLGFERETSASRLTPVIHVVGSRSIVETPDWLRRDLEKKVEELRDRALGGFDREAVSRVEVSGGGSSYAIERTVGPSGSAWTIGPDKKPARAQAIDTLLFATSKLRAERVLADDVKAADLPGYGLDPPRRRAVLSSRDGKVLAEIALGKDLEKGAIAVYAKLHQRVGSYPKSLLDLIPGSTDRLLEKP
jgi:hypothetical protein